MPYRRNRKQVQNYRRTDFQDEERHKSPKPGQRVPGRQSHAKHSVARSEQRRTELSTHFVDTHVAKRIKDDIFGGQDEKEVKIRICEKVAENPVV